MKESIFNAFFLNLHFFFFLENEYNAYLSVISTAVEGENSLRAEGTESIRTGGFMDGLVRLPRTLLVMGLVTSWT